MVSSVRLHACLCHAAELLKTYFQETWFSSCSQTPELSNLVFDGNNIGPGSVSSPGVLVYSEGWPVPENKVARTVTSLFSI